MSNTKKVKKPKVEKKVKAKVAKKTKAIVSEVYCAGDYLCDTNDAVNEVSDQANNSFWTKLKKVFGL